MSTPAPSCRERGVFVAKVGVAEQAVHPVLHRCEFTEWIDFHNGHFSSPQS
jgi:hypothetical protein